MLPRVPALAEQHGRGQGNRSPESGSDTLDFVIEPDRVRHHNAPYKKPEKEERRWPRCRPQADGIGRGRSHGTTPTSEAITEVSAFGAPASGTGESAFRPAFYALANWTQGDDSPPYLIPPQPTPVSLLRSASVLEERRNRCQLCCSTHPARRSHQHRTGSPATPAPFRHDMQTLAHGARSDSRCCPSAAHAAFFRRGRRARLLPARLIRFS